MGADGYEIFDDDVAADVRGTFEAAVKEGASIVQATATVLGEWADMLDDIDDGPVIWLALAAVQLDHGELQPKIRERAVRVIDDGTDSAKWEGVHIEGRRQTLARFRERLVSQE